MTDLTKIKLPLDEPFDVAARPSTGPSQALLAARKASSAHVYLSDAPAAIELDPNLTWDDLPSPERR